MKKYMGHEYSTFAEVLAYIIRTRSWSTANADICELQDLLAEENDESLTNIWLELAGTTETECRATMLNLMLSAWRVETVMKWYNKFVSPWIARSDELQNEMQDHYENELKTVRTNAHISEENLLQSLESANQRAATAEAEILTLKAKLYDLMTAESK
jgi:hypothetical protein